METRYSIYEAIEEVISAQRDLPYGSVVYGFDPVQLVYIPERSCYNHNFYRYGDYILFGESDEMSETIDYYVCDKNFKVIGEIGARPDDLSLEICDLYIYS